jgi:hypothetical protein
MFTTVEPKRPWSKIGLTALIWAVVASVALAILDGILRGPLELAGFASARGTLLMLVTWVVDFRYLADQAIYASTIFFVGAKFFETRSIFAIGFDKLDTAKISLEGPDENNIVWIGHRYGTRLEAETVANAFAERLKESAT